MNLVQAIDIRMSKRVYKNQAIDSTIINQINNLIHKYNNESGLMMSLIDNPQRAFKSFLITYGKFKGISNAVAIVANRNNKDYLEKAGYYGELLLLNMVTFGLDTCWVGVNFDRQSDVFKLKDDEDIVAVIVFGYAEDLPVKQDDGKYGINHRNSLSIEDITTNDQILPHHVEEGIVAILKAPTAKNKQPVRVEYKNKQVFLSVDLKRIENLVELGVAKAHYCLVNGGRFDWGNNQPHQSSVL